MPQDSMTVNLTKKIFMAAPEGAFLVSNCMKSQLESVFEEYVVPLEDRGKQWERIVASQADQRLCRIFENWDGYQTWLSNVMAQQNS